MKKYSLSARPAGASQEISRDFTIDHLERALSMAIAERNGPFHYDELTRIDGISRIRAVRSMDGSIDILSTFIKARNGGSSYDK